MNVYGTEQIRNVVLLGHGGTGKTAIAGALALLTNVTKRTGEVPDGDTTSSYDKEEIRRQLSISTALVPLECEGEDGPIKINLLDTPGFFDSVGEVEETISVADTTVIIVDCKTDIEPGTERAWEMCEKYNSSRLIFVINMNDNHASYCELVVKLETEFGCKIAPFQLSIHENEKFVSSINAVRIGGRRFTNLSDYEECEIPDYVQKNLTIARDALTKIVTKTSEEYMERYFLGREFTQEEISTVLRTHVVEGDIVPAIMGSGINCQGSKVLLQTINKYFPSSDHSECIGVDVSTGERFTVKYDDDVSLSARVFKIIVDPFIGKYSLMKIRTGTFKGNTIVCNVDKDAEEETGKLYILWGKDRVEVQELRAGDIGAAARLTVTQIGDIMVVRTVPTVYHKPQISTPYTCAAYKATNKGEDDKVFTALAKMMEEDLTLEVVNDAKNRQALLHGIGDQQLDVVINKLQSRYKVDVVLSSPKFAFRETLHKEVKTQDKHKKQSGGHGQCGDVVMEFKPSGDLETPHVFEEKIFGGSVPRSYFPAIEKELRECVLKGPLAGYPVMGLGATLLDDSYYPVDSSEMVFKTAAILTFKQGFMKANPVLLKPAVSPKVTVSDRFTGDVMDGLNRREGRVLGMNPNHNDKRATEADIPMSELFGYNMDLRSMTSGLGGYSYEFSRYEQAPGDVQKREIEAGAAAKDSE